MKVATKGMDFFHHGNPCVVGNLGFSLIFKLLNPIRFSFLTAMKRFGANIMNAKLLKMKETSFTSKEQSRILTFIDTPQLKIFISSLILLCSEVL